MFQTNTNEYQHMHVANAHAHAQKAILGTSAEKASSPEFLLQDLPTEATCWKLASETVLSTGTKQ